MVEWEERCLVSFYLKEANLKRGQATFSLSENSSMSSFCTIEKYV
jgi:hypothetical protein